MFVGLLDNNFKYYLNLKKYPSLTKRSPNQLVWIKAGFYSLFIQQFKKNPKHLMIFSIVICFKQKQWSCGSCDHALKPDLKQYNDALPTPT